jgi:hypothetical protein
MVKNYTQKYSLLKSKLDKFEKRATKLKDTNKILNNDLKIIKTKEKINRLVSKNVFNDSNKLSDFESKLNKLSNATVLPSKVYSNSENTLRVVMNIDKFSKFNKPYTNKDIKKLGLKMSKLLDSYDIDGDINTVLNYDGFVRTGIASRIGENIKIYDPEEMYDNRPNDFNRNLVDTVDNFNEVVFFVNVKNKNAEFGGNSKFNDCFWFCLNNGIPDFNPWKTPEELKSFLKIGRCDLIGLKDIERIEKKIGKIGINVSGDCYYLSKLNQLKNLNLVLKNNHYQINHNLNRKVNYISCAEKQILLFDKTKYIAYDGNTEFVISKEEYHNILDFKTNYLLVPRNKFKSFNEEYIEYIKIADELKLKSNGLINIYKCGAIKKTALKLLDDTTKHISPEHIEYDEAMILENSTSNGLIFSEPYEGTAYKGDITSLYPSIYSSKTTLVPIKKGIYKILTNDNINEMNTKLNGNYAYGLYRYNIYPSGDPSIDRLFRFKPINNLVEKDILKKKFYTSLDLRMADMLGLKKELVIDGNFNCVLYPRSHCLSGFEIFNKFVEVLKPLKEQGVEGSKLLLNILSGAISEKNIKTFYVNDEYDDYINLDELNLKKIKSSMSFDKKTSIYKCLNKDMPYLSQFARFKPFMLAQARYKMLNIILPVNHLVKKVYIDSIITTEALEYKDGWGELKNEYSNKNIVIVNNRKEQIID